MFQANKEQQEEQDTSTLHVHGLAVSGAEPLLG